MSDSDQTIQENTEKPNSEPQNIIRETIETATKNITQPFVNAALPSDDISGNDISVDDISGNDTMSLRGGLGNIMKAAADAMKDPNLMKQGMEMMDTDINPLAEGNQDTTNPGQQDNNPGQQDNNPGTMNTGQGSTDSTMTSTQLAKSQVKKITDELCNRLKESSSTIGENIETILGMK